MIHDENEIDTKRRDGKSDRLRRRKRDKEVEKEIKKEQNRGKYAETEKERKTKK